MISAALAKGKDTFCSFLCHDCKTEENYSYSYIPTCYITRLTGLRLLDIIHGLIWESGLKRSGVCSHSWLCVEVLHKRIP